jgi:DNA-directed RNA polymerase specialized sigma24 family protein
MGGAVLLGGFRAARGMAVIESPDPALLALLGGEPSCADEQFRLLRQKLLCFFEWNRCRSPEDLTHEVICRVLRRLSEGQQIYAENPHSYFFGVARNVLHEEWKRPASEPVSLPENFDAEQHAGEACGLNLVEQRVLLGQGLRRLPPEDSDLIVRYFSEGPDLLCRQMGISANAMRIRVCRIRKKLEEYLVPASAGKGGFEK